MGQNLAYTKDSVRGDVLGWFYGDAAEGWAHLPQYLLKVCLCACVHVCVWGAGGRMAWVVGCVQQCPHGILVTAVTFGGCCAWLHDRTQVGTLVSELKAFLPELANTNSHSRAMVTCYPGGESWAHLPGSVAVEHGPFFEGWL
jgi:hypothetical protein